MGWNVAWRRAEAWGEHPGSPGSGSCPRWHLICRERRALECRGHHPRGMQGHHQGLMPPPTSLPSAFCHWRTHWILVSLSGHLLLFSSIFQGNCIPGPHFSVYYVFCSLWCNILPLATVHLILFRDLIFINHTNQPVQVICPSLLQQCLCHLQESSAVIWSLLRDHCEENWAKLRLSFSTSVEIPSLKIPIYYSPLEISFSPNCRKLQAVNSYLFELLLVFTENICINHSFILRHSEGKA